MTNCLLPMEPPDHHHHLMASHSSSTAEEYSPYPTALLKRKRTKRHSPPLPTTAASSSSTSSVDLLATTEEEENMAYCLILLARGRPPVDSPARDKFSSRKFTETTTTAGGKAGFYVYECKTCNKCFPSFQALGGHRASHKKPKLAVGTATATTGTTTDQENKQCFDDQQSVENIGNNINALPLSSINIVPLPQPAANYPTGNINSNNKQLRIHECSICGAEFSSGQALGGHMRRHRPIGSPPQESHHQQQQQQQQQQQNSNHQQQVVIINKERNVLSLDLNLPAPSDENPISQLQKQPPPPPQPVTFPFTDKRRMVFSPTSALVDCQI